ncbi:helix-turn-helix domain-containing protein [Paraburkholderia diazotrophica]|uniref:Transcriptional regulator, XRE family with cupin sensor n=1 Tax=Paraburkholderia diazotrophica TaxID=667676 RepID=A0A1H7EJ76_9BURK|nr:XRE family transcriptional regulator [Paraburkholderia diazotrophica]SEK13931.1 transcriptional regulator, XRE family with cupin sensor [Paraburkholderia diazotrophica]
MADVVTQNNPIAQSQTEIDHKVVGSRMREARKARGLTLMQLSAQSGVGLTTISKAERGEIALTYDKFAALARALSLDLDEIFGFPQQAGMPPKAVSFTPSGGQMIYQTPNVECGMLANDLTGKRMIPMRGHVRARAMSDFTDYVRHSGEEFVFLLEGLLELRFEDGRSFILKPGDSLYFDSSLGHVYLSIGENDADVLVCCADADGHQLDGIARQSVDRL